MMIMAPPITPGDDRLEGRSEEHTSELQSLTNLVCRLLLEKNNNNVPAGPPRGPQAPPIQQALSTRSTPVVTRTPRPRRVRPTNCGGNRLLIVFFFWRDRNQSFPPIPPTPPFPG